MLQIIKAEFIKEEKLYLLKLQERKKDPEHEWKHFNIFYLNISYRSKKLFLIDIKNHFLSFK